MSIPTLKQFLFMFPDENTTRYYLQNRNVFYDTWECEVCHSVVKLNPTGEYFICYNKSCSISHHKISFRKGTFFFGSKLSCFDILHISLLWLHKVSVTSCISLTGHSSSTISNFYHHFRVLVTSALRKEDQIIGGSGVVVEIDETKLGKRKYHRGHRVEGVWVVVGIERRLNGKMFILPVKDRSAATLRQIISKHVLEGSIIMTDMWKGYKDLDEFNMIHLTVNHSQFFKDPITDACTNMVEGVNSGIKRAIPVRNRVESGIEYHLGEYLWRRQNSDNLFNHFIDAIRDIHYFN
jgi:transposase-like protein